ncbi:uncharacterized protein LOC124935632 [Impatiens glandulifera]|uniref:uncharacterized protein LOC124935632 n=1 Tax=Impatiens glandulifera TaxID=253017 RepID=UPI001FB15208|nr:uncharacterized protein LOC124935632 [Impatiens glandulifera]
METFDLESGERTITTGGTNLSFSDDDDVGSCISQLFSTQDEETEEPVGKHCSIFVDIDHIHGDGDDDDDVVVDDDQLKTMRECRICQLTMEFGMEIELGCSCKDDLGVAHKHCAETWFNIKGNR